MKKHIKPVTSKKAIQAYTGAFLAVFASTSSAALLSIANAPLFVTNSAKANVLVILDNSNSMDEDETGAPASPVVALGPAASASPNSKSEIARNAVKGLISTYQGKINMGLMAYQQTGVVSRNIDTSPYDVSYKVANWDPSFVITSSPDNRNSTTKKFKQTVGGVDLYYNVSLPYYHNGGSVGDAGYCYSTTANAFNNGEVPGGFGTGFGPWDNYRCFKNKSGTSDALVNGSYANYWFNATFGPTDSDLAQGITDFGTRIAFEQLGPTWFANTSPGRGYLHTSIADLDSTQAGFLNAKLATSQFVVNAPTSPARPLQNAGLTPLEGTLLTAKNYFEGSLNASNQGGPVAAPPESCGKNFITLMTDGLPSTDASGNIVTPVAGITATAAVTEDLYNMTSLGVTNGNVETYVIGFALPQGVDPTILKQIAKKGQDPAIDADFYQANDTASLTAAFDLIFKDILDKIGSSSSAATNSTSLTNDSRIYQARFNSKNWDGQLVATNISTEGVLGGEVWDAADKLPVAGSRTIITYSRDTNDGIPFIWAGGIAALTDTTQKDILNSNSLGTPDGLGEKRVNYLRGDATDELSNGGVFRDRSNKLGDIINSTPFFLGKPDAGYAESEMVGYTDFRTTAVNAGRAEIVYAGANDGMLHGFNASDGSEAMAYIPGAVFDDLSDLTDPAYGAGSSHRFFADGSPMIADANLGTDVSPAWKTVLAGGLNAGGQGYYALDVTTSSTFSESNAADLVLWEFTDEDDKDMGYSFNQPTLNRLTNQSAQIARMQDGRWALIVGNGYNNTEVDGATTGANAVVSSTGHASLFILFLNGGAGGWTEGTDYIKIDTNVGTTGTPNGLSTPRPIDTDGDGRVDAIYAGDLYGNLWKFDVSSSTSGSWAIAYSGSPLYAATDSAGVAQPITTAPLATLAPGGNYLIGFSTGLYLGLNDIATTGVQTIYAIVDAGAAIAPAVFPRSNLQEQTVLSTPTVVDSVLGSIETRLTSENAVNYTTKKGWFMDLPDLGERVVFNPILRDGRFVFTTLVPDTGICSAGGSGWIMELDYLTGGAPAIPPFIGVPGDPSGIKPPGDGIPNTPTVIGDPDNKKEYKIVNESTGNTDVISESVLNKSGRLSWREIIR